jgi:hypothetical protein
MFDIQALRSRKIRAYRRLLLDESGGLRPEAETVLSDLVDFARFFKSVPPDPQALAVVEGSRHVVRHILKRAGLLERELKRQLSGPSLDE